jgi:hypothetical protein
MLMQPCLERGLSQSTPQRWPARPETFTLASMVRYERLLRTVGPIAAIVAASTLARAQVPAPTGSAVPPAPAPPGVPPPSSVAPGQPPVYAWGYSAPMEFSYIEGRPIPTGYHLETRQRSGLILAGGLVLGITYALSISVAGASREHADRWLLVPVAGPFIDLAARPTCDRTSDPFTGTRNYCNDDSSARTSLMLDGLTQVGGAVLTIVGLATPRRVVVRDDAPYAARSGPGFTWSLAPRSYGRSGHGFALAGTF